MPFYTSRINTTTGPILTGVSDVNSWYNSLVLTFRKRMSDGLEFVANYTLAKATDGGQVPGQFGTFNGTDSPIDPYNRKLEYAAVAIWISGIASSATWSGFRSSRGRSRIRRCATCCDGFAFSSIVTVATGQPVTGTISGNPAGAIAGGPTGGAVNNSGHGDRRPVAGTGAQSLHRSGHGQCGFRGSAASSASRERVKLSLLGEAFNVFNHTNVFTVNTQQYTYTAAGSGAVRRTRQRLPGSGVAAS